MSLQLGVVMAAEHHDKDSSETPNANATPHAPAKKEPGEDIVNRLVDLITRPVLPLFRRLGLSRSFARATIVAVQLIILLLGATQLPWWVGPAWTYTSHKAGVLWVTMFQGNKAPPQKFTIMLARFENDPDNSHLYRLLAALHKNFNGAVPIAVEPVTFDDRWDGTREDWVLAQAQDWLGARAHVIVWGHVWPDQTYSLRMVSRADGVDALWDTIESGKAVDGPSDPDSVVSSKIVAKALGLIINSPALEDRKLDYLDQMVALLMPLVQQMSDKIPIHDRVNLVLQFAQASVLVEDRKGKGLADTAPDVAMQAIEGLLGDPAAKNNMSPAELFRLQTKLGELENAGGVEADHDGAIGSLWSIVREQNPPDGVSAFDFATASVDYANALEERGECEAIPSLHCPGNNMPQGKEDFGRASFYYERAILLLRPLTVSDDEAAPEMAHPEEEEDANWVLGEADDRLGLDLIKMAKLSNDFDLTWTFEILGEALRIRTRDDYESDWAFTLTRLGEAYQVQGRIANDTGALERAEACFDQALPALTKDAPGDNGFDRYYRDQVAIYIAGLKKAGLKVEDEPSADWRCTTPTVGELARWLISKPKART